MFYFFDSKLDISRTSEFLFELNSKFGQSQNDFFLQANLCGNGWVNFLFHCAYYE